MRKTVLVSLLTALICVSGLAQESNHFGGVQSLGFSATYSPDSSHILIGESEQRRVWTLGLEYTHLLHQTQQYRLEYEGSIIPLYEESDPTLLGTVFTLGGQTIVTTQPPVRVVAVAHGPIGTAVGGNSAPAPIYALFGRQNTYAGALSPLGVRITALPRHRIQPTFAVDLGFVVSTRDIPVDQADQFNYLFSFGPGFQFFASPKRSIRVEYIYRHISNASQGTQNPGVDQGVIRVTLSGHR